MSDSNIVIPNVDAAIAQKLQAVVDSITSATDTFQTASQGIGFTQNSVHGTISSIMDISEGQAVDQLSTLWGGTSSDGRKADNGLTDVITHLNSLKGVINDHLPAIITGLTAIQTAQSYQHNSHAVDSSTISRLQGQINDLVTALGAITSATGPVNTGINSIVVGGSCSTGIQPGDHLPSFDNRTFMTKKGTDGEPSPEDMRKARADANQAQTDAANAENTGISAEMQQRQAQLAKDPQTGTVNAKSQSEAQSILQAESEGLVKNARRPNLANGEPNLDFVIDGGYADIKTPINPSLRSIGQQAQDIAGHIQAYSADVKVIIDLKNLSPADRSLFITDLQNSGANMTNVIFLNQ